MKLQLFFPALIFALLQVGCNSLRSADEHLSKIKVHPVNGSDKFYSLLSVRGDSDITVLDWEESKVRPVPISHARAIKRDSISYIARIARQSENSESTIKGSLIGFAAGLAVSAVTSAASHSGFRVTSDLYTYGLIGGVAGYLIGSLVASEQHLSLSSYDDRELLHSLAFYPHQEPQELQLIK